MIVHSMNAEFRNLEERVAHCFVCGAAHERVFLLSLLEKLGKRHLQLGQVPRDIDVLEV